MTVEDGGFVGQCGVLQVVFWKGYYRALSFVQVRRIHAQQVYMSSFLNGVNKIGSQLLGRLFCGDAVAKKQCLIHESPHRYSLCLILAHYARLRRTTSRASVKELVDENNVKRPIISKYRWIMEVHTHQIPGKYSTQMPGEKVCKTDRQRQMASSCIRGQDPLCS